MKGRRGPDGKLKLGRNMTWAERQAKSAAKAKESRASGGKWGRNTKDATARAKKSRKWNTEDAYVRSGRIRDVGQTVPKGYMRTGGRYFAKVANMRPIFSKTSQEQRNLFYANKEKFLGPKGDAGWMRSIGNQGMYNGQTSEANFRKTSAARKIIDADGGTYSKEYMESQKKKGDGRHDGKTAGVKTRAKSRYIMAIGQDGHVR